MDAAGVELAAVPHGLSGHGEGGGDTLRLGMGQERLVKLHGQLAGIVVAHRVAHGHHRRHSPLQQGMGGAGEAGLLGKIELPGLHPLCPRLPALGHGQEVVPVPYPQDVAGVAGAEEEEPWQKAAGVMEEVKQFLAGEAVSGTARPAEFKEIPMAVAAPMDHMVAAVLPDLGLQPFPGDAMGEEVGHDAAPRVDLLRKEL